MKNKRNERKNIMREISRKTLHLVVGTTGTLLAYFGIITGIQILLLTGLFTLFSIIHKRYEFRLVEKLLSKVDRKDIIPGYGAIMLGIGIGLSFILFPKDIALIAGICVSMVDGISTIIAAFQERKSNRRNSFATIIGSIVGFAFLTSFLTHIQVSVILTGVIVAAAIDLWYNRIWLFDDNIIMPLLVGAVSYMALIIISIL